MLDQPRNRVYITNAGYNRIEVFDTVNQKFLTPIAVNQLPHQMAMSTDGNTLYVASAGGELIDMVDLNLEQDTGHINFPPIPRQAGGSSAPLIYPTALAVGFFGAQFVMSNGTQWEVIGGTAVPRAADTITLQSNGTNVLSTPVNMLASPDFQTIVTLSGSTTTGYAYVYNASSDAYVASGLLFTTPIQGFFGPLSVGSAQSYLTRGRALHQCLSEYPGRFAKTRVRRLRVHSETWWRQRLSARAVSCVSRLPIAPVLR